MTLNLLDPPRPCDLGAPERYDRWRHMQYEAVLAAADSKKRCIIQGAPTGFGKSLVYVSQALLSDVRACILTSTKALQSQLLGDFEESGLIEIKGLNAYDCIEGRPSGRFGDMRRDTWKAERGLPMSCDEAPCQSGAWCNKREGGCLYYDAYRKAGQIGSKLVVTNYAYWMSIHKYGEGLGKFDLLILDEAHNAIDELGSFIGTEIRASDLESVLPGESRFLEEGADQTDWISWGDFWYERVTQALDQIRQSIKESERTGEARTGEKLSYAALRRSRDLRRMQHRLSTVKTMQGEWVIDRVSDSQNRPMMKFDPVWPGEYAESALFNHIPKIVMVSATVRPETAYKLGMRPVDVDFKEYPSSFPKERRPIIFIPTAHMNRNAAAHGSGKQDWHLRIDHIIGRRLDRSGIIHTVSYNRSREVFAGSQYKELMMLHDNMSTRETVARFKEISSTRPRVLISPVLDTGYDFPYEQAEYQIITKMPFPVTVDKIMKARCERDPEYRHIVTAIKLMQMVGRINRAEDDSGETFIIDSDFEWWYKRWYKLLAKWFLEAVRVEQVLGAPAMKLQRVR